jgi:hypothetical protein
LRFKTCLIRRKIKLFNRKVRKDIAKVAKKTGHGMNVDTAAIKTGAIAASEIALFLPVAETVFLPPETRQSARTCGCRAILRDA